MRQLIAASSLTVVFLAVTAIVVSVVFYRPQPFEYPPTIDIPARR